MATRVYRLVMTCANENHPIEEQFSEQRRFERQRQAPSADMAWSFRSSLGGGGVRRGFQGC